MLIDTHCHLHFDAFDPDREAVITRAREFGVKYFINVGTDPATNDAAAKLASEHDFIFCTAGLHPHHAHEVSEEQADGMEKFIAENKPVALGEIGLDTVKSQSDEASQKKMFVRMIHLALKHDLPVIVHSRSALEDTLEILKAEGQGRLRGVMHCFSYDKAALKRLLDLGFLASFTCNITFKNGGPLLDVAAHAPLDRIMLETDSPYLAPQVYRGKRNEPSCLRLLAQFLAEKRGIDESQLEDQTTQNAVRLFGLKVSP